MALSAGSHPLPRHHPDWEKVCAGWSITYPLWATGPGGCQARASRATVTDLSKIMTSLKASRRVYTRLHSVWKDWLIEEGGGGIPSKLPKEARHPRRQPQRLIYSSIWSASAQTISKALDRSLTASSLIDQFSWFMIHDSWSCAVIH